MLEALETRITPTNANGVAAIGALWNAEGGPNGIMGAELGSPSPGTVGSGGEDAVSQRYQYGLIFWSPDTGALAVPYSLPQAAQSLFSYSYLAVRDTFLRNYFYDGFIAQSISPDGNTTKIIFGDQTKDMGDALVTFSQEASILAAHGLDPSPAEHVVTIILEAFDALQGYAAGILYPGAVPLGFFIRDFVSGNQSGQTIDDGQPPPKFNDAPWQWRQGVPAGWVVSSDFDASDAYPNVDYTQAALSLDQLVYMMNGWWSVKQYDPDQAAKLKAEEQTRLVMDYLTDIQFRINSIDGFRIHSDRGGDQSNDVQVGGLQVPSGITVSQSGLAAPLVCQMADAILGSSYFANPMTLTDIGSVDPISVSNYFINVVNSEIGNFVSSKVGQFLGSYNSGSLSSLVLSGLSHSLDVLTNSIVNPLIQEVTADFANALTTDIVLPVAALQPSYGQVSSNNLPGTSFSQGFSLSDLFPGSLIADLNSIGITYPSGISQTWVKGQLNPPRLPYVAFSVDYQTTTLQDIISAATSKVVLGMFPAKYSSVANLSLVEAAYTGDPSITAIYAGLALGFNDPWAALIEEAVQGIRPPSNVIDDALALEQTAPATGPASGGPDGWNSANRWEHGGVNEGSNLSFNGLDFLSLETLMLTEGISVPTSPIVFAHPSQGSFTVQEGQTLNIDFSATGGGSGNALLYSVSPTSPGYLQQTGQFVQGGQYSWTPAPGQAGTYTVTVTAGGDNERVQTASQSVQVTVVATNPYLNAFSSGTTSVEAPDNTPIILSASGVTVPAGFSQTPEVLFYQDTNNDGQLEVGTDTLLNPTGTNNYNASSGTYTWSGRLAGLSTGTVTLFAQADLQTGTSTFYSNVRQVTLQVGAAPAVPSLVSTVGSSLPGQDAFFDVEGNQYLVSPGSSGSASLTRYDLNGHVIGSPVTLASIKGYVDDVAGLPSGHFIVAFEADYTTLDIQEYNSDGSAYGSMISLNVPGLAAGWPLARQIAMAAPGEFAVLVGAAFYGGAPLTYYRYSQGNLEASQVIGDGQGAPAYLAMDPNGASVVVWDDFSTNAAYAQRFDASGHQVAQEIPLPLFGNVGTALVKSVAVDEQGRFVVLSEASSTATGSEILVQRFLPDGTPVDAAPIVVNDDLSGSQEAQSIAFRAGRIVITWFDGSTNTMDGQAYVWDNTLRPLGGNFSIAATPSYEYYPGKTVAIDPQGSQFSVAGLVYPGSQTPQAQRFGGLNTAPSGFSLLDSSLNASLDVVSANLPAGSTVGTFQTSQSGTWSYSLVPGDGSDDNARFQIVNGQLQIGSGFNPAGVSHYSIRVRATPDTGVAVDQIINLNPAVAAANGLTLTDLGGLAPGKDLANSVVFQPDGKIILVGSDSQAGVSQALLARYNADGSVDPSWGGSGIVPAPLFPVFSEARAAVVQPDGKVVVIGDGSEVGIANQGMDIGLARYNRDGSLDTSFGNGGLTTLDFGGNDYAAGVVLDSAGRIVVAGYGQANAGSVQWQLELARYLPSGSLDSTFGNAGKATLAVGQGLLADSGVALTPDGKIVAFGYEQGGPGNAPSNFIARLLPDGTLDPTLNGTGYETIGFNGPIAGTSGGIAVQPDGRMLVAGSFGLARLNADASMDTTFNGTGLVQTASGTSSVVSCSGVVLEPDDKILVSGTASNGTDNDFVWIQYAPTGAVSAIKQLDVGAGGSATSLALSSSGVVAVAGEGPSAGITSDLAVWQFDAKGPPTATISGPATGSAGQDLAFNVGAASPALDVDSGGFTYSINWGDGTPAQSISGAGALVLDHAYSSAGHFTIQVAATDDTGASSPVVSMPITVVQAIVEPDPFQNAPTALVVTPVPGANQIRISFGTGGTVDVTDNATDLGTFPTPDAIDVDASGVGSSAATTLTVDFSLGYSAPADGIHFRGGGADRLVVSGGTFVSVTADLSGPVAGSLSLVPTTGGTTAVSCSGVTSLAVLSTVATIAVDLPAGSEDGVLQGSGTAGSELLKATAQSFPDLTFNDPGTLLQIGGGVDGTPVKLTVQPLEASFSADLSVVLHGGAGEIDLVGPLTLQTLTAAAQTIAVLNGTLAANGITLDAGGSLVLGSSLAGIASADGTGGNVLLSTTGGDITQSAGSISAAGTLAFDAVGNIGSSTNRIEVDSTNAPAAVIIGEAIGPTSAYLDGEGDITLADVIGGAANTKLDVTARGGLTVVAGATIDTGAGAISLAADSNPDGSSDGNSADLMIQEAATVNPSNTVSNAILLRGYNIDIAGGSQAAVVGAHETSSTVTPLATTEAATTITTSSATLNATVNPEGAATSVVFVYGTDPNLATGTTTTTPQAIGVGTGNVAITAALSGLLPNTTYYYEVVATNAGGATDGAIEHFTTSSLSADVPNAPVLSPQSDTGVSNTDGLTKDNGSASAPLVFAVSGVSPPDAFVQLYNDTNPANPIALGSPVQAVDGTATLTLSGGAGLPLADGSYAFAASASTAPGGTPSALSTVSTTVTIRSSLAVTSVSPSVNFLTTLPNNEVVVTFNHWLAGLVPDVADGTGFTSNPYCVMLIPSGPNGAVQLAQTGAFWSATYGVDGGDLPLPDMLVYHQNADGTSTITLTPTEPLSTDLYLIEVGNLGDLAGNRLTGTDGTAGDSFFASFDYRPTPVNFSPLRVTGVTADNGSVVVNNDTIPQPDTIGIQFNKPLDTWTANTGTIGLYYATAPRVYAQVPSVVTYSPTTDTAYLTPEATLSPGVVYVVSVSGGVSDDQQFPQTGVTLGQPYYTTFEVSQPGVGQGAGPLTVQATTPTSGTLWNTPLGYVSVTFSEPVDLTSLGRYSAMLISHTGGVSPANSGNADIPLNAKLAFNPNTNQLIIVPTGLLRNDTIYLVSLHSIAATNGDALAGTAYATFLLNASSMPQVAMHATVSADETAMTPSVPVSAPGATTAVAINQNVSQSVRGGSSSSSSVRPQRVAGGPRISILSPTRSTLPSGPLTLTGRWPSARIPSRSSRSSL